MTLFYFGLSFGGCVVDPYDSFCGNDWSGKTVESSEDGPIVRLSNQSSDKKFISFPSQG